MPQNKSPLAAVCVLVIMGGMLAYSQAFSSENNEAGVLSAAPTYRSYKDDLTGRFGTPRTQARKRPTVSGAATRPASPAAFPPGALTYFGGTAWDPVDGRWEALPDSVWTFDTGVGSGFTHTDSCKNPAFHASMEGWTSRDLAAEGAEALFRRMGPGDFAGTPCVGSAAGLDGDYSLWVGFNASEADNACWIGGRGYGNLWVVGMGKTFAYDGTESVLLEYDFVNETEEDFDFVTVLVDTSGAGDGSGDVEVVSYTGTQSGSESLVLTKGVQLPNNPGSIRVSFRLHSDDWYSDQDGLKNTGCGAFAVDNILVRNTEYGGGLNDLSDFESGDDGWSQEIPGCYWEDFARLAALNDLPQALPPGGCNVADSVLVFFDSATGNLDDGLLNWVYSPVIDLADAGLSGDDVRLIQFDRAVTSEFSWGITTQVGIQFYPDTCAASGEVGFSPLIITYGAIEEEDSCRVFTSFVPGLIPVHAEEVRIGLGVANLCELFPYLLNCGSDNTTPWFDNVRVMASDFGTIQAAVDAASPGDTIFVPPGTYAGPGNVNVDFGGKNVVLYAPFGPEVTTIDGQNTDRAFVFQSGEDTTAAVEGFTIRRGYASGDGGGVWITDDSHPTFRNCTFDACNADFDGGAVAVDTSASVRVYDSLITDCSASSDGGGVYINTWWDEAVQSVVWDTEFDGNDAGSYGGGLFADEANVRRCLIHNCTAGTGGGLYVRSGSGGYFSFYARIKDCTIVDNSAGSGGGVRVDNGFITDCTIQNNVATGSGGGVEGGPLGNFESIGANFEGCTVNGNQAGGAGGGFYMRGDTDIYDCIIQGNVAHGDGGGVCLDVLVGDTLPFPIKRTLITGNEAGGRGGGVLFDWNSYRYDSLDLERTTITGNTASLGGGIGVIGYIHTPDPEVTVKNCTIRGNCASVFGALAYVDDASCEVSFVCSATDSSEDTYGPGTVNYTNPIYEDPLFCGPLDCSAAPTVAGDYHVRSDSPCLPANNSCGYVGLLGEGCAVVGVPGGLTQGAPIVSAPNPFTNSTSIRVAPEVAGPGPVTLRVFDINGRLVRELRVPDASVPLVWDGRDAKGRAVAPGVYFARASTAGWNAVTRVVRIR